MSRPRKRFCPQGHDKDAPGGSKWYRTRTNKGTWTKARQCVLCVKSKDWRRFYMKSQLKKDLLDFLGQIVFTISYRPIKDKAAQLLEELRKETGEDGEKISKTNEV